MDRRLELLKEQPREVKQIKKVLPFTVRDLGNREDLEEWKRIQAEKEAIWEAGKAERYAAAKTRAISVLMGETTPKETSNDIADERFKTMQIEEKIALSAKKVINKHRDLIEKLYDEPKLTLWNKIYNFFLNINFEPKQ